MVIKMVGGRSRLSTAFLEHADSPNCGIRVYCVAERVATHLGVCILRFAHAVLLLDGAARSA